MWSRAGEGYLGGRRVWRSIESGGGAGGERSKLFVARGCWSVCTRAAAVRGLTIRSHIDVDDAVLVTDGQHGAVAIGDGGQAHDRAHAVAKALRAGGSAQGHRASGQLVVLLVRGHEGHRDWCLGLKRVATD